MRTIAHYSPQIDTVIRIITPENITFTYQLASMLQRILAFGIDMLVLGGIQLLTGILLLLLVGYQIMPHGLAFGIWLILTFFLTSFFGGFQETIGNGQTLGKRLFGIRVVSTEGQPINSFQAITRNVLRWIDLQPIFFAGIGFAMILVTKRFQRFGDLVCGTMVVVDENAYGRHDLVRFKHPEIFKVAEQIPALPLSSGTLKALALYVHRRKAISPRRREHIAAILATTLIEQYGLPENLNEDLLLCAIYHTQFVAMADKEEKNSR
ncbi:MAG: RDD family protein [Planctomycetaceae bacterium]|jgi:uncharacterized RDD family membrane protein YckC|nr:RDD family protein [Planctomycetaceae bacterium]